MIYLYVIFSSVYFAYVASKSKHKETIVLYSLISLLIPCVVGGLRAHSVGIDTIVYGRRMFQDAMLAESMADYIIGTRANEIGFKFVCYVAAKLTEHENGCYFAYQLCTVPCIYIGAWKHRKDFSMPLLLLIWYFMLYLGTYNIMRQAVAAAVIFMEIDRLEKKQYFKFSIAIIIASMFHTSALIAFPTMLGLHVFINSRFMPKSMIVKMIAGCALTALLMFLRPIMELIVLSLDVLAKYRSIVDAKQSTFQITSFLMYAGELFMLLFYSKHAKHVFVHEGYNNFEFYKYNLLFALVFPLIIRMHNFAIRVLVYSTYLNCFVLAAFPLFSSKKHLKLVLMVIAVGASALYFIHIEIIRQQAGAWPYQSILSN